MLRLPRALVAAGQWVGALAGHGRVILPAGRWLREARAQDTTGHHLWDIKSGGTTGDDTQGHVVASETEGTKGDGTQGHWKW